MESVWKTTTMHSPLITPAPDAALVANILQRQVNGYGSPVTCGYVDGDADSPATCAAGSTCASDLTASVHFCCVDPDSCVMPSACYAATAISDGLCDSACQENTSILKWYDPRLWIPMIKKQSTESDLPLSSTYPDSGLTACYTREWVGTPLLYGYGCAQSSFIQIVYSTVTTQGESSTTEATTTAETTTAGATTQSDTATNATTQSDTPTNESSGTSGTGSTFTTSSSTTSTTATSTGTNTPTPGHGPHLSTGAIVGISIGGAFVFLVLLTAFLSRKKIQAWLARRKSSHRIRDNGQLDGHVLVNVPEPRRLDHSARVNSPGNITASGASVFSDPRSDPAVDPDQVSQYE
ncbi:hypothetical protein N7466_000118 [Penicillium verhagenii]|uniref:uncharacterized protein n=1 Tax=Penicillium verhagenii TaxID=1562060 RepID=UPI00254588A6|nr:uncharacterized protein N7466_000118 [Penicillium verhagenii]KAJ5947103.1 hypothetical protein N7466_000118 [Penicillium verhagenii]